MQAAIALFNQQQQQSQAFGVAAVPQPSPLPMAQLAALLPQFFPPQAAQPTYQNAVVPENDRKRQLDQEGNHLADQGTDHKRPRANGTAGKVCQSDVILQSRLMKKPYYGNS